MSEFTSNWYTRGRGSAEHAYVCTHWYVNVCFMYLFYVFVYVFACLQADLLLVA